MSDKPQEQLTRVNFSLGRKISDGNYGSLDFHCSISSDVKPGEKASDVVKKCISFAEAVVKGKIDQAKQNKLAY